MEDIAKNKLKDLMITISESGYHAGWMGDLEHYVWHALQNGPKHYGQTYIDENIIQELKCLADQTNGWWIYRAEDTEPTFMPLNEWHEYYSPECAEFNLSQVFHDIKGDKFSSNNMYLIYDGECPICTYAARNLKITKDDIKLVRINAKKQPDHPLLRTVIESMELNLKDEMIIFYKRKLHLKDSVLEFFEEQGECIKVFKEHPNHDLN